MTKSRRQRRLEEHRIRVQQLRARFGDPNEALDRLVAARFDPEVLERMARELAAELTPTTKGVPDEDIDDDAR
jgi:hypothetical protein